MLKTKLLDDAVNDLLKDNSIEDVLFALSALMYKLRKKQLLDDLLLKIKGENK